MNTFKYQVGELSIAVEVVCYDCNDGFRDQWVGTDIHQGGITIKNPNPERDSWKYFIPQQTTLAECAAMYAKRGDSNPSGAAYQSLQDQLERDLSACDYGFRVTAEIAGVTLIDAEPMGCGFDYSYLDDGDLMAEARQVWDEYNTETDVITAAKAAAIELLANTPALEAFSKV